MGRGLKARAGAPPAGRFSDGGDDVVADSEGEDDRHEARLSMKGYGAGRRQLLRPDGDLRGRTKRASVRQSQRVPLASVENNESVVSDRAHGVEWVAIALSLVTRVARGIPVFAH